MQADPNTLSNTEKGKLGEDIACDHLISLGHKILHRNFRFQGGEIDIISSFQDDIFFYEVKYRTPDPNFHPLTVFRSQKKMRMRKQAELFLKGLDWNSYSSVSFGLIYVPSKGQIEIFDYLF